MKRLLTLLLAAAMTLSLLAGCGSSNQNNGGNSGNGGGDTGRGGSDTRGGKEGEGGLGGGGTIGERAQGGSRRGRAIRIEAAPAPAAA